jgi:hypothetical protein
MRTSLRLLAIVATLLAGLAPQVAHAAAATTACPLPVFGPGAEYHPVINPADFSPNVTNPFMPLKPGQTFIYFGTKDGQVAVDFVIPSTQTRVVDGVTTRVVEDALFLNGLLEERTSDYYAQDRCGNVWYFGEDTAELDALGRVVSREGSFHAGVDGAQPGVFMQARPEVGRVFRQEWYEGHAEDAFKVISTDAKVRVPHGSSDHALRTAEWTALEPGVLDNKYYVRGIGEVEEVAVKGPVEKLVLLAVIG